MLLALSFKFDPARISKSVVNRDILFLRKQARDNLQYHIHDRIPWGDNSNVAGDISNSNQLGEGGY
jgi:hypothetical protein